MLQKFCLQQKCANIFICQIPIKITYNYEHIIVNKRLPSSNRGTPNLTPVCEIMTLSRGTYL